MSGWGYLSIAIVLEVFATTLLKFSDGFTKLGYANAAIALYCACFFFMAPAYKTLPAGVVYAVWSGIGIVAIAALGVFYFKETLSLSQIIFIALILIGAVGLSLTTTATEY